MLLLIETWLAACSWVPDWTSCSIVRFDSDSRCSIQVSGSASAGPWPCRRRESSDTNARGHRRIRARHVRDHEHEALGIGLDDRLHLVDPAVGEIAIDAARGDVGGDAAQILDQRKPQHDRNRPQLAELERRHGLIGGDEAREAFRVHAAVAVRDGLERDVVDARAARPTGRSRGAAARGCNPWANGASRCGSALRSGRNCRAAIRPPA